MNSAELDDFLALNTQLFALIEAGVPIDIGPNGAVSAQPRSLEAIGHLVASRIRRGNSLEDALQDDGVPAWYRYMVLSALRSRDINAALIARSRVANSVDESRYVAESVFVYPLIVCTFAYLGFVSFCFFFVPTFAQTYREFNLDPARGMRALLFLRETLPYWVGVPPVLLMIFLGRRFLPGVRPKFLAHTHRRLLPWLTGLSRGMSEQRSAYFAESLATLEDSELSFEKALPVAAGASGDPNLVDGARALAAAISSNRSKDTDRAANRFPPFLRWAMLESQTTVGRGRALRMAASLYRRTARRRVERSRIIMPMILLVTVGGSVTLLYGLALFLPIVNLLEALSR
jgi:type II secretory pathway component PulF